MWRSSMRWLTQRAYLGGESKVQRRVVAVTSASLLVGSFYVLYSTYQESQEKKFKLYQSPDQQPTQIQVPLKEEIKFEIKEEVTEEKLPEAEIPKEEIPKEEILKEEIQVQEEAPVQEEKVVIQEDLQEQEKWQQLVDLTEEIQKIKAEQIKKDQIEQSQKEQIEQTQKQQIEETQDMLGQKDLEEYLKLYEEHLIVLHNKCDQLQHQYLGSVESLYDLNNEITHLQEKLQQKNEQVFKLQNAIYLSQVTFNLLVKLEHDVGDLRQVLGQTKGINDELVQKAYDQYISNNYQYLCDQGVPSRWQLLRLFSSDQVQARFAVLLNKTNKSWWGYLKAKLNMNTVQDVDPHRSLSILKKIGTLVESNDLNLALQEIQKLQGLPKKEMERFYQALQARVGLEAFANILSSHFKFIVQVI